MITLKDAIEAVGGPEKAAQICGVSARAVYKWLSRRRLPRTEYTGETNYASKLAAHSTSKQFTGGELLESLRSEAA